MTTPIDLGSLPAPTVIEALDYEAILKAYTDLAKERLATILPDWNPALQSDPIVMVLQACAYRELVLRARVNDAARASLLAFATAGDLDHLAAFYGVVRLAGEADAALRLRVQQRIIGWANAGGAAHYRYWALTASSDVKDAAVDSPEPGLVRIAVLSAAGTGTPAPATLEAVRATVGRDDVRVLTDTVEVVPAAILPVTVTARVWLYPDTPTAVFTGLAPALTAAVDAARGLGWDCTRSWLTARLHAAGVQRVELLSPAADVVAGADSCIALTATDIQLAGRDR